MARKVLLPAELEGKLIDLTRLKEEVKGVLLYKPQGDYYPLESIFMTGVGIEGHVRGSGDRLDILNEFFRLNKDYHYVEFNTHSNGTIATYGQYYATHFSDRDTDSIANKMRDDKNYMHMLVTPQVRLLCGIDNPQLKIVNGLPDKTHITNEALSIIATRMGKDLRNFKARMI